MKQKDRIIGGWTLHRLIGDGGQGKVFAAYRREGEPEAALKKINCKRPKKRSRFMQEISVHAALSSQKASNIIPILDHNLEEIKSGGIKGYLVMPMAVTTLEEEKDLFIGRTELCVEVFRGVLTGIGHAHAADIIHRDIKPSNILFLDKALKEPLVSDFGICFLRETPDERRLTDPGETVGAKFFMAPEQERGGVVDVGPSADIYALGKLLHYMLTGRFLYREKLEKAFTPEEVQADSRLSTVLDRILKATVIEEPEKRLQTTGELLDRLDEVLSPGGGSFGPPNTPNRKTLLTNEPNKSGGYSELSAYQEYVNLITSSNHQKIHLEFDNLKDKFRRTWENIYQKVQTQPSEAPAAAQTLIQEQTQATALILAIARCDSKELFRPVKLFLEFITKASEDGGGYLASLTVPHVQAGYLYMAMSMVSLEKESWNVLYLLLTDKFEWFYQSGRPIYSYGFSHPYFFHPEALNRKASEAHDFYRKQMSEDVIIKQLELKDNVFLDTYLRIQFLMSLRGSQYIEEGNEQYSLWPDFGRFNGYRVRPLLDRIFNDDYYAEGILRSFGESREKFFERLNSRLSVLSKRFSGSNYWWNSITTWEPRD